MLETLSRTDLKELILTQIFLGDGFYTDTKNTLWFIKETEFDFLIACHVKEPDDLEDWILCTISHTQC